MTIIGYVKNYVKEFDLDRSSKHILNNLYEDLEICDKVTFFQLSAFLLIFHEKQEKLLELK